jgi:hypothetical protein
MCSRIIGIDRGRNGYYGRDGAPAIAHRGETPILSHLVATNRLRIDVYGDPDRQPGDEGAAGRG